jgi:hypothetical protein
MACCEAIIGGGRGDLNLSFGHSCPGKLDEAAIIKLDAR